MREMIDPAFPVSKNVQYQQFEACLSVPCDIPSFAGTEACSILSVIPLGTGISEDVTNPCSKGNHSESHIVAQST